MIQFTVAVRNGVEVILIDCGVGSAVTTYAGRIFQGHSGRWEVQPSQFTVEVMAEGQFDDLDAAKRYVEKCLKEEVLQTTEQEVNAAAKKTRPAPKPQQVAAPQAAVVDDGLAILDELVQGCEGIEELMHMPAAKPPKRQRVSKAAAEADDVPAGEGSSVYGDQSKAPGKQRQRKPGKTAAELTALAEAEQANPVPVGFPSKRTAQATRRAYEAWQTANPGKSWAPSVSAKAVEQGDHSTAEKVVARVERRAAWDAANKVVGDFPCIQCGMVEQLSKNQAYAKGYRRAKGPEGQGGYACPPCLAKSA